MMFKPKTSRSKRSPFPFLTFSSESLRFSCVSPPFSLGSLIRFSSNVLIKSGQPRFSTGSHVLSPSSKPFHFRKYSTCEAQRKPNQNQRSFNSQTPVHCRVERRKQKSTTNGALRLCVHTFPCLIRRDRIFSTTYSSSSSEPDESAWFLRSLSLPMLLGRELCERNRGEPRR